MAVSGTNARHPRMIQLTARSSTSRAQEKGLTLLIDRMRRPIVFVAVLTLVASASVGSARAEVDDQLDAKEVHTQAQLEDLTFQIDMLSVEDDVEVTVDSSGTIVASQDGQEMIVNQDGSWTIQDTVSLG